MAFQFILTEKKEQTFIITVNRPDKLNALNWQTMVEIHGALKEAKQAEDIRGVIITGAGEKAFVAGADIEELSRNTPVGAKEFALQSQEILGFIENFPKPVIAAVNGFCLGGGCELAMACHMRIVSESARFGQPEVNLGIIPGNGGTQRLSRLVGKGRAIELILSANIISAAEAHRIGLVNQVSEPENLINTCQKLLATIYSKAPLAIKLGLEAITHGLELTLEEGVQLEANLFGLCMSTEDAKEGTKAFLEKRKPEFKGI